MSKSNTVKLTLDPAKPPVMSKEQKARLARVAAMTDDQIDTSDIPVRLDAVWVKAVEMPHNKQSVTMRLDADILKFFKSSGNRYQTRINSVLRSYVEASKRVAA